MGGMTPHHGQRRAIFGTARRPRPKGAGRRLYDSAVRQARTPYLYAAMGAPDTVEGRFELLTAHVVLLIETLREAGLAETRQALFDAYVSDLDGALREMGVGDLTVGKRMRELGKAFYGRASGYRAAYEALPDRAQLAGLIGRTILAGEGDPTALAGYFVRCRAALSGTGEARLLAGEPAWADAAAPS